MAVVEVGGGGGGGVGWGRRRGRRGRSVAEVQAEDVAAVVALGRAEGIPAERGRRLEVRRHSAVQPPDRRSPGGRPSFRVLGPAQESRRGRISAVEISAAEIGHRSSQELVRRSEREEYLWDHGHRHCPATDQAAARVSVLVKGSVRELVLPVGPELAKGSTVVPALRSCQLDCPEPDKVSRTGQVSRSCRLDCRD